MKKRTSSRLLAAFLAVMLAELVSMGLEALVGMLSEFIFSW